MPTPPETPVVREVESVKRKLDTALKVLAESRSFLPREATAPPLLKH